MMNLAYMLCYLLCLITTLPTNNIIRPVRELIIIAFLMTTLFRTEMTPCCRFKFIPTISAFLNHNLTSLFVKYLL